jgi:RNA polymerase primary sigma factor
MVLPTYVEHGQIAVNDDDEVLRCYFSDISDSEPLSREREVELALSIQGGDMDARNELIRCNLRFVVDVARRYRNRGLGFAELISAGNMGLITAAERFDGSRGYKFISYAVWWIRQSILQSIAEQGRTVRLPLNKVSRLREISRTAQRLAKSTEDEPYLEAIAAELEVPLDEVLDVVLSARAVRSLDESLTDGEEGSLLNVLADDRQASPDESVCDDAVRSQIRKVLGGLSEREEFILSLCFGLYGEGRRTLEDIGEQLNLTRERVRQIKERALVRLRSARYGAALSALREDSEHC